MRLGRVRSPSKEADFNWGQDSLENLEDLDYGRESAEAEAEKNLKEICECN